eukprot:7097555-Alexandrium_andersonii.AAC.1
MSASLVGSEMCIRDSRQQCERRHTTTAKPRAKHICVKRNTSQWHVKGKTCLLYTSDAADDM